MSSGEAQILTHGYCFDGLASAVLATHLHQDHFDATAARLLPRDLPLLCQPEDV